VTAWRTTVAFLLAAFVVLMVAGRIDQAVNRPTPRKTPTPTPTATPAVWIQRIDNAIDERTSVQTAHNTGTGQTHAKQLADCQARITDFNNTAEAAGPYWPTYIQHPLNPSKDCK
jgi:hypothetical protein